MCDISGQLYHYTGANFKRPDFKRMMADVENGKVGIIIVKDQSRLGRDYLQTGMLMEITFPQYDVRFIAVNDGVDSINGVSDFSGIKNYFNEFYAMATANGEAEAERFYKAAEREKQQLEKRNKELDNIIRCLYEDRVCGRITPERYDTMESGYEQEQTTLKEKLIAVNDGISKMDMRDNCIREFITKAKKYIEMPKLTYELLRVFIRKIEVFEKMKKYSRKAGNLINIHYAFQLPK